MELQAKTAQQQLNEMNMKYNEQVNKNKKKHKSKKNA